MHESLVAGRKTRGYTRYSPTLFPLLFCLIGRCSRRWGPGAGDPRCRPPQREDPRCRLRRGVPPRPRGVWRFPCRRPRLFDHVVFVLAFLRQPCILVSVLRYYASANLVLSSCCIRALVAHGLYLNSLYYFICSVVL